jgi:carboxyl-terminal processing protease
MKSKLMLSALLLSGSLTVPAWSQSTMPRADVMAEVDVMEIEQNLLAKGFNPGQVDGVMDQQTIIAIRDFQRANNLQETGRIDDATAHKLGFSFQESGDFYRAE